MAANYIPELSHPPQRVYQDGERRSVIQAADQTVADSITPVASDLSLPLLAGRNYGFEIEATFELEGTSPGYRFKLVGPTSPTASNINADVYNGVDETFSKHFSHKAVGDSFAAALAAAGDHTVRITGTIENGSSAGNLTLQFAQETSHADDIILHRGSRLSLWEISK